MYKMHLKDAFLRIGNILGCILGCKDAVSKMFKDVVGCFGMFWDVLGCFELYAGMYPNFSGCSLSPKRCSLTPKRCP